MTLQQKTLCKEKTVNKTIKLERTVAACEPGKRDFEPLLPAIVERRLAPAESRSSQKHSRRRELSTNKNR